MHIRLLIFFISLVQFSFAQLSTEADSIRGSLRLQRTCFDVTFYDLKVGINPDSQSIYGSNTIHFTAKEVSKEIQIDLFDQYSIHQISLQSPLDEEGELFERHQLTYKRVQQALFITLPEDLIPNKNYKLKISYSGKPNVAKRAPWDGGFVWSKDSLDRHFAGVACEGWGASSWWPCKDHLSDEPDSMQMEFTVPLGYQCISNGVLVKKDTVMDLLEEPISYEVNQWKVTYPINTYNVSFYLGNFKKIEGEYISNSDTLATSFYCLDYNLEKAKRQFQQVNPMLKIYEDLFGKYPFWNDGYKLVEAPYLGMEHQSAIAYGNEYMNGYKGHQPKGVDFDYIIIHESGHEYWGNSISMNDMADMWIHESFCTYTEVLYAERMFGKEAAMNYLIAQRRRFGNDSPIIGPYGVNTEGSSDMYNKGSWILHTIRNVVSNDSIWFATLKQFHEDFRLKNTNSEEVLNWFGNHLGDNVQVLMNRYLRKSTVPKLQVQKKKFLWMRRYEYKWENEGEDFVLPIRGVAKEREIKLIPTNSWQKIRVSKEDSIENVLGMKFFLFDVQLSE